MLRIMLPDDHNDTEERFPRKSERAGEFPEEPLPAGLFALRTAMFLLSAVVACFVIWIILE
jgi:hypothetical protein